VAAPTAGRARRKSPSPRNGKLHLVGLQKAPVGGDRAWVIGALYLISLFAEIVAPPIRAAKTAARFYHSTADDPSD
jgi:hypothetical protein